jgi:hypothetical protein
MKLETHCGLLLIKPEDETEASLLCLWHSEVNRILEHEGTNLDVLCELLQVQTYTDKEDGE